jgi:ATP-dependent helicase HrpB
MGGEIDRADPLAHEEMLVVAEITGSRREARITRATGIDALDVELGFGSEIAERVFFGWDDERNDLVERVERRLGALDFGTHERPVRPSAAVTEALVDRIVVTRLAALDWTAGARNLQARARLVAEHRPDVAIERIDDDALLADATEIFGSRLDRGTGRADIESVDVRAVLADRLGWEGRKLIDRLAPETWNPPRGRPVPIDYTAETPRVAVRAQQVFGLGTTPSLVDGRLPLTLVLLSPADRPIQITSDLAAFWSGSWAEVRKDMAGRYPKHDWPTDPLSP